MDHQMTMKCIPGSTRTSAALMCVPMQVPMQTCDETTKRDCEETRLQNCDMAQTNGTPHMLVYSVASTRSFVSWLRLVAFILFFFKGWIFGLSFRYKREMLKRELFLLRVVQ